MGGAGGSFGQAFAQTLIQGMLAQNQIQQTQADLKIKRDLADANLKQHMAQTADIERRAKAVTDFTAKLKPQMIGGGMEGPQTMMPGGQPSLADVNELIANTNPGALAQQYSPHYFDPTKGLSSFTAGTGQTNQIAAPQAPPINPLAEQALSQALGGSGATAAPTAGGEAPPAEGQPAAPAQSPLNPGGIRYEPPSISVDPKGGVTIKTGPVKANVHMEKIEYPAGSGNYQTVAVAIDPTNPTNRQMIPLGKPLPSEQMQKLEAIAESWGIPPGDARKWAVGAIADATTTYSGPAQAIEMEKVKAKLQSAVGKGLAGTRTTAETPEARAKQMGGIPSSLQAAKNLEVQTAAEKTAAETQAKLANEAPSAAAANKIAMLQSVERQIGLVEQNFNPAFVGKGFSTLDDALKAQFDKQEKAAPFGSNKYQAGALRGNLREFFGQGSGPEYTFRASLLDASDLLLRARSGAQINEQEYTRLKGTLPNLTDEPNVFVAKMKRFQDESSTQINDTLKLGSTSARDLLKQRGGTKTAPAAPKGFRPE
jgi:hypothetical protein